MKVIKAAAVQIGPVLYSREKTVEKVGRKIHELGQQAQIIKDTGCEIDPISGGCFTAIVPPNGMLLGDPCRTSIITVVGIIPPARMIDSRAVPPRHGRPRTCSGDQSRPSPPASNLRK